MNSESTPPEIQDVSLPNEPTITKDPLEVIAALQAENARLSELIAKFRTIVIHASAEKREDIYFICGQMGPMDEMRLPAKILVCPAFGLDGFAVYSKTQDYSAPGY